VALGKLISFSIRATDGDRKKGRVGGAWSDADLPSASSAGMAQNAGNDSRTQSFSGSTRDNRSYSRNSDYDYDDSKRREPAQGPRPFPQPPVLTGQTSGAQSDGSYERNLVNALCAPGGMRAIPPKDKMDAFLKSATTLDAEIVGPILEDCLSDDQWTVRQALTLTLGIVLNSWNVMRRTTTGCIQGAGHDRRAAEDRRMRGV
jgi:hypothetical protein